MGSTEPYTGYVWTNVYSSESQTAIPAWQSIGTINKDTTILVNDLGDREDVAMSQLSISNLTNEYNVSVNLPSREYVYYSPKWKSIEYDESVSLYDDAITYHVGDKCNINGDISNTYQSVEEAIGEAPYSKEINNKYTLEEAFYNLPLVLKRNGIILSFVNHNNIVEKWENIKGINNVNFKNTHWKLVGSSKISSIDQSIYNLSIFISKVFPLDHFSVQDIKDMSDTGYLNSSGNIITSGQYYEKFKYQIIKTEPNTVYHISGLTGGEVALHIVLYGFNEEFIYGESYPKELFVSGDIINYIGLCTTKEEEAIVESYRIEIPYVDITYGNILINSEKIEKNKYIDVNNGVSKNIETELILGVTDYIYVHNRNIFIQGGSMGIGESIGHAVFDLNKKFIRGVKTNEIYLDKDEYYIRCTLRIGEEEYKVIDMDSYCDNSYPNNAIAYPFIEQPRFSGTFNNLLYCGTDGKNLLNPKKIIKGNYYISTDDGKIYFDEYDNFGVSDYIPIDEDGLNITGGYVAGERIGHAIYDFEKKFIRGVRSNIVQYQEGDCFVRFTLKKGVDTIQVEKGLTPSNFQPFGKDRYYVNPYYLNKSNNYLNSKIEIVLPDKLYAVVGDTFQLFYRGCVKSFNPYGNYIRVSCDIGKQFNRYYELTPVMEDIGEHDLRIDVIDDDGKILGSSNTRLICKGIPKSPSSNKKILVFGDSLTSAGIWCRELDRRLTESGGNPEGDHLANISFCGSKKNGKTGYFGVGGWSWYSYTHAYKNAYRFEVSDVDFLSIGATYTNNGNTFTIAEVNIVDGFGNVLCTVEDLYPLPEDSGILIKSSGSGDGSITYSAYSEDDQNPLWDKSLNRMSFVNYANEVSNGEIDIVYTLLSWNGLSPWKSDFTTIFEYVKIFVDTLHEEYPNAKLGLVGIQVPSVNGGMGSSYGATGTGYADSYGNVVTVHNLNKAYQEFANREEYSGFVDFINLSTQFDSENNMPYSNVKVNTRNESLEKRGSNGVHPSIEGYYQIADTIYRHFVVRYCND